MKSFDAPLRAVELGSTEAQVEQRADGSIVLRRSEPLGPYPGNLSARLKHWAAERPDGVFIAEPCADGWNRLSYAEALGRVRSVAQFLIDTGLSGTRPIAILSENSLEHALLALGAMYIGVPCCP